MFFDVDLDWAFSLADVAGWTVERRHVLRDLGQERRFGLAEDGAEVRRGGVGNVDGVFS